MKVKVLSIRNPLSYLVVAGIKDIENRTWSTDYRGELYIHSCGNTNQDTIYLENLPKVFESELDKVSYNNQDDMIEFTDNSVYEDYLINLVSLEVHAEKETERLRRPFFITRSIVGKVDLVDIVEDSTSPFAIPGLYHWIIKNPVMFKRPIEYVKGKLRLFDYNITMNVV